MQKKTYNFLSLFVKKLKVYFQATVWLYKLKNNPSVLIASSDKAKELLGWKPKYADLSIIIQTAWEWHMRHPNGYAK